MELLNIVKPTPVDREIVLSPNDVLLSITDLKGDIEYCNEEFVEVSGYEEYELVGSAHNIVRHPDMPKVVFKLMWERLKNEENIVAIVKNMGKTGRYYWVMTDFVIRKDSNGNVTGYKAFRKPAPKKAVEAVIPFYKKLREIEDFRGIDAAMNFFTGFFDGKNTNYDDFIENIIVTNMREENKAKLASKAETKKKKVSFLHRIFDLD